MDNENYGDEPRDQADQDVPILVPSGGARGEEQISASARNQPKEDEQPVEDMHKITWLEIVLAASNAGLVIIGIIAAFIYGGQLGVMRGTLNEMRRSGATATDQAWQAVGNINWLARTMDASVKQAQGALQASIEASRTDQRAWVGLAEFSTIGGTRSKDGTMFTWQSLQIHIHNSGKTPAVDLGTVIEQTSRRSTEAIGDFDDSKAELERRMKQDVAKAEAEIRKFPQMADSIRASIQAMRAADANFEQHLFPAGQVLAPGIATVLTLGRSSYAVRDKDDLSLTIYVFGKITYNDVFHGTPLRVTKFCLRRTIDVDSFTNCPTGNSMN